MGAKNGPVGWHGLKCHYPIHFTDKRLNRNRNSIHSIQFNSPVSFQAVKYTLGDRYSPQMDAIYRNVIETDRDRDKKRHAHRFLKSFRNQNIIFGAECRKFENVKRKI